MRNLILYCARPHLNLLLPAVSRRIGIFLMALLSARSILY